MLTIRPARAADFSAILLLNQEDLPHLSALSLVGLERLATMASYFRVAEGAGSVKGFLLAMTEDAAYESVHFRWFKGRYPRFIYIDRVVVARDARRAGVASSLYRDLEDHARMERVMELACEVNVRPPNPESLRFHERRGFFEVGQQATDNGQKTVSLRLKRL